MVIRHEELRANWAEVGAHVVLRHVGPADAAADIGRDDRLGPAEAAEVEVEQHVRHRAGLPELATLGAAREAGGQRAVVIVLAVGALDLGAKAVADAPAD
ncbi:hypothetical protein ACFQX4_08665 [Roseomonas sp. GCM10028921]